MKKISVIIFAGIFTLSGPVCSVADGMTEKVVGPKIVKKRIFTRKAKKLIPLREEPAAASAPAAAPTAERYSIWANSDATRSWQPYSYP